MTIEMIQLKKKRSGTSISSSSSDEDVSVSIKPLSKLAPAKLYNELMPFKMDEDQLQQNGYPFFDHENSHAVFPRTVNNQRDWVSANDLLRKCSRCSKHFNLNQDGTLELSRCYYHHRPKFDIKSGKKKLTCCSAKPGPSSSGCMASDKHVFTSAWDDTLFDFTVTPPPAGLSDHRSTKVYGLDCELVHTLNGLEVARVSVVDIKGRVMLDTFVLPVYKVLCYNSPFSGVYAKDMENAISFDACRLQLFQLINSDTLLVGHSLESDLKALRLVHYNVIDTSVLFAVRKPNGIQKFSLQNLAQMQLGKHIQNEESGHSSVEDSLICLELLNTRHMFNVR